MKTKSKRPLKGGQKKPAAGPFLATAVFCDSVVRGEDGAMTAVRIIDHIKITLPANAPEDVPSESKQIIAPIEGLVSFRKGHARIKHDLQLVVHSPSGKRQELMKKEIALTDKIHGGFNLRLKAMVAVSESGLYWMDVRLDSKLMTRMPLLVTVSRASLDSFAPAAK